MCENDNIFECAYEMCVHDFNHVTSVFILRKDIFFTFVDITFFWISLQEIVWKEWKLHKIVYYMPLFKFLQKVSCVNIPSSRTSWCIFSRCRSAFFFCRRMFYNALHRCYFSLKSISNTVLYLFHPSRRQQIQKQSHIESISPIRLLLCVLTERI